MISAWYGGRGPGFVATLLTTLGEIYFLIPPIFSFAIEERDDLVRLAFFLVVSLIVVLLIHSRHQALEELTSKNEALARQVTQRQLMQDQLQDSHRQLEKLAAHFDIIREEESGRIAREVHDVLGQMLTALKLDIGLLTRRIPQDPEAFLRTEAAHKLVDSLIQTVRRIAIELRPAMLDDLGLTPTIRWQTQEFIKRTGLQADLELDEVAVEADVATGMFRIFQEILTNVARHAQATNISVSLTENDGCLRLAVRDDGVGIESNQGLSGKSLGLLGMRERARRLGGTIDINGRMGGTKVVVTIPRMETERRAARPP